MAQATPLGDGAPRQQPANGRATTGAPTRRTTGRACGESDPAAARADGRSLALSRTKAGRRKRCVSVGLIELTRLDPIQLTPQQRDDLLAALD